MATTDMGRKLGGMPLLEEGELGYARFGGRGAASPCSTMWPGLRPTKLGAPPPFGEQELDAYLTQYGQGRGLPACQVSS